MEVPTANELSKRIRNDIDYFNGKLPERNAIAWSAYLSALLEWQLLSIKDHDALYDLLPWIADDPSIAIMLGRPDDDDVDDSGSEAGGGS